MVTYICTNNGCGKSYDPAEVNKIIYLIICILF